jgi:hypothetical protein
MVGRHGATPSSKTGMRATLPYTQGRLNVRKTGLDDLLAGQRFHKLSAQPSGVVPLADELVIGDAGE